MAYIDTDKLLNRLPDDLPYKASVKRVLIQAPTADVVPKSEVEKIFAEIDNALHDMAMEYHNAGHPEYFAVCEIVHHKVVSKIEKKYIGDKR